jgi:hypothetical protein
MSVLYISKLKLPPPCLSLREGVGYYYPTLEIVGVSNEHIRGGGVGYYYPTLEIVGVDNGFYKTMGNPHPIRRLLRLS